MEDTISEYQESKEGEETRKRKLEGGNDGRRRWKEGKRRGGTERRKDRGKVFRLRNQRSESY